MHPAARQAWSAALDDGWADPARLYGAARRARTLLDNAREVVAAVVGSRPDEVTFPQSGAAALHAAVGGVARAARSGGATTTPVVASPVEHSAVLHAMRDLGADHGHRFARVDHHGRVDVSSVADALAPAGRPPAVLAAVQAANHEVGTLQPVAEVAQVCADAQVPLLVDAAALLGRQLVPQGWSLLAASAHKWGGPPGVGVLVVRRGTRWRSPWPDDERTVGGSGFENVPGALAAAAALSAVVDDADRRARQQTELVDVLRTELPRAIPDVEVVGDPQQRLPHVLTFSCLYANGEALVTELDRAGFAVSSGSSCTASTVQPSHVLEAMGALTHGNIRVSLRGDTDRAEVEAFLRATETVVSHVRTQSGVEGL